MESENKSSKHKKKAKWTIAEQPLRQNPRRAATMKHKEPKPKDNPDPIPMLYTLPLPDSMKKFLTKLGDPGIELPVEGLRWPDVLNDFPSQSETPSALKVCKDEPDADMPNKETIINNVAADELIPEIPNTSVPRDSAPREIPLANTPLVETVGQNTESSGVNEAREIKLETRDVASPSPANLLNAIPEDSFNENAKLEPQNDKIPEDDPVELAAVFASAMRDAEKEGDNAMDSGALASAGAETADFSIVGPAAALVNKSDKDGENAPAVNMAAKDEEQAPEASVVPSNTGIAEAMDNLEPKEEPQEPIVPNVQEPVVPNVQEPIVPDNQLELLNVEPINFVPQQIGWNGNFNYGHAPQQQQNFPNVGLAGWPFTGPFFPGDIRGPQDMYFPLPLNGAQQEFIPLAPRVDFWQGWPIRTWPGYLFGADPAPDPFFQMGKMFNLNNNV